MRLGAALVLVLLPALPAYARHKSETWARTQFAAAERMREALNGRPSDQRTRAEYQHVISAYRRVYFGSPTSTKADPSVVAVAELLVEMGRRFDDDQLLRSAIRQYEFLRREYPGSRNRFEALFTIGEIYQDDLHDSARARDTFQEFLHRYPRNRLAAQARQALSQPVQQADLKEDLKSDKTQATAEASDDSSSDSEAADKTSAPATNETSKHKLARVTGVRHWSTPDYTRVAIDIEDEVKFASQRITHPDRIFFDLLDTKLASTLVGKSFDVDDGFLKKIRVAQFQPGKTRVVLEVDDLSDYNAFLLPNPTRLIIDIHGKQTGKSAGPAARSSGAESAAKAAGTRSPADPDNGTEAKAGNDTTSPKSQPVQAKDTPAESGSELKKASATDEKPVIATAPGPKKRIVEADDDDDETSAELRPPALKALRKPASAAVGKSSKPSRSKAKRKTAGPDPEVHEAQPTANGDRSLIRALGLKIGKIVIDPGHGGHDTGTIGPNGLEEKDLVLEVARRLGKLLESRLGAEVVYTRSDDSFIPLETRTAIANREQADLFISVHANSSRDPDARGVETYYLNFTSSADALEVAARENAVSDKSIHELQDLVKKIALKEKIEESREFATDVQRSLHSGLAAKNPGLRDRGVKKAPFIVLIGANMPSILAEISFVSNPGDERRLETPAYRQRIAESLYRGVAKYVRGLSGVKVASTLEKREGQ